MPSVIPIQQEIVCSAAVFIMPLFSGKTGMEFRWRHKAFHPTRTSRGKFPLMASLSAQESKISFEIKMGNLPRGVDPRIRSARPVNSNILIPVQNLQADSNSLEWCGHFFAAAIRGILSRHIEFLS